MERLDFIRFRDYTEFEPDFEDQRVPTQHPEYYAGLLDRDIHGPYDVGHMGGGCLLTGRMFSQMKVNQLVLMDQLD